MRTIAVQSIAPGQPLPVSVGSRSTVGAVVLYNESNTLILVAWAGSSMWLPAWTGECFYMNLDPGFTGSFTLTASTISNAVSSPSSSVAGYVYAPGEPIPGTFPVALVRQTNIGNGSVPVSSVQSVINDGSAIGTTVVEATPLGAGSSQLLLKNDGSGSLSGGVLTLDDAGNITAVGAVTGGPFHGTADAASSVPASGVTAGALPAGVTLPASQLTGSVASATNATNLTGGSLSADGGAVSSDGSGNLSANSLGYSGASATDMFISNGANTGKIIIDVNGAHFECRSPGDFYPARSIQFKIGSASGGSVSGSSTFVGTGAGTYTHGMTATPGAVLICSNQTNSTTTVGVDSIGSTTVHVNINNPWPFVGHAIRN